MVYGWMPTMLRFKGPLKPLLSLAELARRGPGKPHDETLAALLGEASKTLNNSVVGTTKLLHFLRPELYAIWDSRVYRALFDQTPHPYRVENPDIYPAYLHWLGRMTKEKRFGTLKKKFEAEAGYPVTGLRAAEATLYCLGERL